MARNTAVELMRRLAALPAGEQAIVIAGARELSGRGIATRPAIEDRLTQSLQTAPPKRAKRKRGKGTDQQQEEAGNKVVDDEVVDVEDAE